MAQQVLKTLLSRMLVNLKNAKLHINSEGYDLLKYEWYLLLFCYDKQVGPYSFAVLGTVPDSTYLLK